MKYRRLGSCPIKISAVGLGDTAISAGVLCGFLDFRFSDTEWREGHPKRAGWYGLFAERPSMRTNEHSLS